MLKVSIETTTIQSGALTDHVSLVRWKRIRKLRDSKNKLSESEWENTLLSVLTQCRLPKVEATCLENLEVIAHVTGESLAIVLRQNISGITPKLGEILLKVKAEQELDILSWTGTALQRSDSLENEVQDLTAKYEEQSATIAKLNEQLMDLIKAKKEHEEALLQKFRELLNSKKLKIRDQQRLLAGAKVDPKQAEMLKTARSTEKHHAPTPSRAGKRKASGPGTPEKESIEDDSFEPAAPMQRKDEAELSEQINTPDASDVTEDESDDDLESGPPPSKLPDRDKLGECGQGKGGEMDLDEPPPVRQLPFKGATGGGRTGQVRPAQNEKAGDEDGETDDDEL